MNAARDAARNLARSLQRMRERATNGFAAVTTCDGEDLSAELGTVFVLLDEYNHAVDDEDAAVASLQAELASEAHAPPATSWPLVQRKDGQMPLPRRPPPGFRRRGE